MSENNFKKSKRYGQSISVYEDIKGFFEWMDETGLDRSRMVRAAIKQHPLYKNTYQQYLKEKKDG